MRSLGSVVVLFIAMLGCGSPQPPGHDPAAVAPIAPGSPRLAPGQAGTKVVGERIEASARTFGRAARIFHTEDRIAVSIDTEGTARHTGSPVFLGQAVHVLPFSEPVDDVVVLGRYPDPRPGANRATASLFCARTRTHRAECVIDFEATATTPRETRRFPLPGTGITQFGTASPVLFGANTTGVNSVICLRAVPDAIACWGFTYDGMTAVPFAMEPWRAEATVTRISPSIDAAAWRAAEPGLSSARSVAMSEPQDIARIVARGANIAVQCALLDAGQLTCFGPGVHGELGDGTLATTARVRRPLGTTPVLAIAMLRHLACAVVAGGRVACWGTVSSDLPLPRGHRTTRLSRCTLDREASRAQFAAAQTANRKRAEDCGRTCKSSDALDACLGCVERCTAIPYVFRHDVVCQEPLWLDQTLMQRDHCLTSGEQAPSWLTNQELENQTPEEELTLAPVFLRGIDDAIDVALPGRPTLCVLHRAGNVTCLD
jgi:hypothetical protein